MNDHNDVYNSDVYAQRRASSPRTDISDSARTAEVNNEFLIVPQELSSIRDVLVVDDTGTDTRLTVDDRARRYNGTIVTGTNQTATVSQRGAVQFPVIREQPVAINYRNLSGNSTTLDTNPRIIETW